jgi:hypothetical protein
MRASSLTKAATLFWVSWLLMPGVGVTDAGQIFDLVSSQRSLVLVSVIVQLVSAALYAPGLVAIVAGAGAAAPAALRRGAWLLLVGAMGSAADAVLHLLAFAMTAPGLDRASLVPVMSFMQGPGLVIVAPLIVGFFAGGVMLSRCLAAARVVSPWNVRLHGIALGVAILGGAAAGARLVSARLVGLAVLGLVAAAQAWIGIALSRRTVRPIRWRRLAAALALVVAAAAPLGAASAPIASFIKAQEANRAALRDYTWKSRTELTIDGESRQVRLDQVRYDLDGMLQRTRIGGSGAEQTPAPGLAGVFAPRAIGVAGAIRQRAAARKARDIRALTEDLQALASSYTHVSPDRLQAFTRSATTRPGAGADAGLVLLHGTGVLQAHDAMSIWIEPAAGSLRRVEIVTSLEGRPARIVAEFRTLPNGLTYQARTTLRYPHDGLVITVEQFDHQPTGGAR